MYSRPLPTPRPIPSCPPLTHTRWEHELSPERADGHEGFLRRGAEFEQGREEITTAVLWQSSFGGRDGVGLNLNGAEFDGFYTGPACGRKKV